MVALRVMDLGQSHNMNPMFHVMKKDVWVPEGLKEKIRSYNPRTEFGRIVKTCLNYLPAEQAGTLLDRISSIVVIESCLNIATRTKSGFRDYGTVGHRVVTTAGVGYIVDAFQNLVELELQKFHALGTASNAEAVGDTQLFGEILQYPTANTRPTGSLAEGGAANIFQTWATCTVSAVCSLREHGVFSSATASYGILLDRTMFSLITLAAGDSIDTTYQLTVTVGG